MVSARLTDEAIAAMRKRIGMERPAKPWNTVATKDAIRHFAEGFGDLNPLWIDEEYARKTKYGGIVAPPTFIFTFSSGPRYIGAKPSRGTGLPGLHGLFSGCDLEFYQPVLLNDRLTGTSRLADVIEKKSEFAERIVFYVDETVYRNQREEAVAKERRWHSRWERYKRKDKYASVPKPRYTPEELRVIEEAYDREEIRGAIPRYWEEVQVWEELVPMVKGPLVSTDIVTWMMGWGSPYCMAFGIRHRYLKLHPAANVPDLETNAPDLPERGHWDDTFARHLGLPGAYDIGTARISWMAHLLTNWMGDDGRLKKLSVQLRRPIIVGDTTWCKAKVVNKLVQNGEHLVELEIWGENQRGEITTPGQATVRLPSRTAP